MGDFSQALDAASDGDDIVVALGTYDMSRALAAAQDGDDIIVNPATRGSMIRPKRIGVTVSHRS